MYIEKPLQHILSSRKAKKTSKGDSKEMIIKNNYQSLVLKFNFRLTIVKPTAGKAVLPLRSGQ
jgi:hypothetical protein